MEPLSSQFLQKAKSTLSVLGESLWCIGGGVFTSPISILVDACDNIIVTDRRRPFLSLMER